MGRNSPETQPTPEIEPRPKSQFVEMLKARWAKGNFVCVGLDPNFSKIPEFVIQRAGTIEDSLFEFNREIIDATNEFVCAYKPNVAFYEAFGEDGFRALRLTIKHIKENYPDIPVILDAKRGDIGNTNNGYVQMAFERMNADAITVNPYLGREALQPFLDRKEKGILVLCRTSNPGAGEFQDFGTLAWDQGIERQVYLYQYVARRVATEWNENGNVGLVVGATYPEELAIVREIVGDMPILIPGIGTQGGEVEATVKAGMNSKRQGMIINSSRRIIFASHGPNFAEAARRETQKLRNEIDLYREAG